MYIYIHEKSKRYNNVAIGKYFLIHLYINMAICIMYVDDDGYYCHHLPVLHAVVMIIFIS